MFILFFKLIEFSFFYSKINLSYRPSIKKVYLKKIFKNNIIIFFVVE